MVSAAMLGFILWLLGQAGAMALGGLAWAWGEVWKALVALLAKWLAQAALTVVLAVAALIGVPSSYWPWWFRKYPIFERLKPPPDRPAETWGVETKEEPSTRPDERPSSPGAR